MAVLTGLSMPPGRNGLGDFLGGDPKEKDHENAVDEEMQGQRVAEQMGIFAKGMIFHQVMVNSAVQIGYQQSYEYAGQQRQGVFLGQRKRSLESVQRAYHPEAMSALSRNLAGLYHLAFTKDTAYLLEGGLPVSFPPPFPRKRIGQPARVAQSPRPFRRKPESRDVANRQRSFPQGAVGSRAGGNDEADRNGRLGPFPSLYLVLPMRHKEIKRRMTSPAHSGEAIPRCKTGTGIQKRLPSVASLSHTISGFPPAPERGRRKAAYRVLPAPQLDKA